MELVVTFCSPALLTVNQQIRRALGRCIMLARGQYRCRITGKIFFIRSALRDQDVQKISASEDSAFVPKTCILSAISEHRPKSYTLERAYDRTSCQKRTLLMMNALKKFFRRISDVVGAPSYSSDVQKRHEEKEQMSQPQEEFIDSI
jgi:hypothetical protein